jgi:glycosyltransferase involved in cell wall biosynthesis
MRVLISAGWLGGAGGAERALYSILRALDGDRVDVVVRQHLGGAWAVTPSGVRVSSPLDVLWWGAGHRLGAKGLLLQKVANPLRRVSNGRYDAYLQFLAGAHIARAARPAVRLVIPSGNVVAPDVANRFDAVAMQAPDNVALVPPGARSVLLPPPVFDLAPTADAPPVPLPREYLLTVFNPYDPVKGLADLERAADEAPLPFVWCHSQATIRFDVPEALKQHPRIRHVTDATPPQLRFLYEHCAAYVSFSRTEGFGWSAADALRYAPAVATRPIGAFSNDSAWQPGVSRISDTGEIDWERLLEGACEPTARDLSVIDGRSFRLRLSQVISELVG